MPITLNDVCEVGHTTCRVARKRAAFSVKAMVSSAPRTKVLVIAQKRQWRAQTRNGDRLGLPPLVASVTYTALRIGCDYLLRITKRQGDEPRGIAHLHAHQDLMLAL